MAFKYVHELISHAVKPDCREQYRSAAYVKYRPEFRVSGLYADDLGHSLRGCSEQYFAGLAKDPSMKVKLTGSWETLIGPVDNFGE
jgi:hypothetical protein